MISMFLSPGSVAAKDQIYPGQATVQTLLLLAAGFSVPWMLCGKPLMENRHHKQEVHAAAAAAGWCRCVV